MACGTFCIESVCIELAWETLHWLGLNRLVRCAALYLHQQILLVIRVNREFAKIKWPIFPIIYINLLYASLDIYTISSTKIYFFHAEVHDEMTQCIKRNMTHKCFPEHRGSPGSIP